MGNPMHGEMCCIATNYVAGSKHKTDPLIDELHEECASRHVGQVDGNGLGLIALVVLQKGQIYFGSSKIFVLGILSIIVQLDGKDPIERIINLKLKVL